MLDNVKINIKRRKRKTTSIYIERDGSVSVYVPEGLTDIDIDALIQSRQYQIYRYLTKRELFNESRVEREPVNGQSFLYLGRNYYLQFSNEVKSIKIKNGYFLVPESKQQKLSNLFKEFYRERGNGYIPPRVDFFAEKMGLHPEAVTVLELKNRWASCSVKRVKLNFHWKVMMAPVTVINYLIVHELSHLKFKKHDPSFWNQVDKVLPNYRKQMDWLKKYGASLTLLD